MKEVREYLDLVGVRLHQAKAIVISLNGQRYLLACTYLRQLFSHKLNGT